MAESKDDVPTVGQTTVDNLYLSIQNLVFGFIQETGRIMTFAAQAISYLFQRPYRISEIVTHLEYIGNKSVFIIILTGTFTGLALSYQIYLGFVIVNAQNLVGPTVALGITRELGPVLTGLIVAARAGGSMAARLGTMRVTEQIDALNVMGVNPIQYLISPRIVASVVAMPLLTVLFDFVAILGAYFLCIRLLEMDDAIFWQKIQDIVNTSHINEGLFKAAVFGLVFSAICSYRGYTTTGGARGVGESTNRGVVLSMVMIIVLDYFLTNFVRIYYQFKEIIFG